MATESDPIIPTVMAGIGVFGRRADRARDAARQYRTDFAASEAIQVLTAIIVELAEDVDSLRAALDQRPIPIQSFQMGRDVEGRNTILIRWEQSADPSPRPTEVHLGKGVLAPGFDIA